jgi:hypothetical protein
MKNLAGGTPSDTKIFIFGAPDSPPFYTSDGRYGLFCVKEGSIPDEDNSALLGYLDKNVTIQNSSAKKGWNYLTSDKATTTLPSGFNWIVFSFE